MKVETPIWQRFGQAWVKYNLFQVGVLVFTLWLTGVSVLWCIEFAKESKFDGVGTAAVIGAILLPVNGLMGYVFKWFGDTMVRLARKEES